MFAVRLKDRADVHLPGYLELLRTKIERPLSNERHERRAVSHGRIT